MATRRRRHRDDDDRRKTVRRTDIREGEHTSATTTAPEPPAGEEGEDMQAFFSSGHGPAEHYDRSAHTSREETGEAS